MSEKNLLSDTDYTKGWDNRFGVAVAVGKVTKLECSEKGANVRVIMPDRVDHKDQPLISKPVPVLQIASTAKKSFAMPRLNTNVVMVKLPNGTSNYMVVGSFYTKKDPPPVTDPMLDYVEYEDGSTMQFNASDGTLTWKLKGKIVVETDGDISFKTKGKATIDAEGDVLIKSAGNALLDAPNLELKGALKFTGNITHQGNIVTSGQHTDVLGLHTASRTREDLEARIAALEKRVAELERRSSLS
jgi:phage baseplate assembly protein V